MSSENGPPAQIQFGRNRSKGIFTMPFNGRPLVLLALLFALGIALGRIWGQLWIYPLLIFCACLAAGIVILLLRKNAWIPIFLCALFMGVFLCSVAAYPDYNIMPKDEEKGETVAIEGTVCELPSQQGHLLILDEVSLIQGKDTIPLKGRISVYVVSGDYPYGQRVTGTVNLRLPETKNDKRSRLLARGIWYQGIAASFANMGQKEGLDLYGLILSARLSMEKTVDSLYGNAGPVMKAMLLGNQDDISEDGMQAFRTTGTAHILAVSGLNVGFIVVPIFFLLTRIIRTRASIRFAIISTILVFHCILTGLSPPILRATIMALFILAGRSWGRKPDTPTALAASFILILAINPMWLYDIGFQLSFSGVAGILLVTKRIEQGLKRLPTWLVSVLAASAGGQAGTLPFTALHFNQIPALGLLVNLAAVPLSGLIVVMGFLSVLLGLIWLPLGLPFAFIAKGLLMAMLSAVAFGATVPGMVIKVEKPTLGYFVWYFICLLILSPYLLIARKTRAVAGGISGGICLIATVLLALRYNIST